MMAGMKTGEVLDMDIQERIQLLRKAQGLSQEELADRLGVSRQAVSKWEMGQSLPELDKVLVLSEYFHVSTDYLLRGEEPQKAETSGQSDKKDHTPASRALYIASAALMLLGLLTGCALWHEWQSALALLCGFALQIMGLSALAAAKWGFNTPVPQAIAAITTVVALFMPLSLLSCRIFGFVAAPYPTGLPEGALFLLLWVGASAFFLKKLGIGRLLFGKSER